MLLSNIHVPLMFFQCWNWAATSDKFANLSKPTIWQSSPLHAVIGQMCKGEKVCIFLSSSLFSFSTLLLHFCVQLSATPWMPLSEVFLKVPLSQFVWLSVSLSMTAGFWLCLKVWLFKSGINTSHLCSDDHLYKLISLNHNKLICAYKLRPLIGQYCTHYHS